MNKVFFLILGCFAAGTAQATDLCFSNIEQSAVVEIKLLAGISQSENVNITNKELVFDIGDTAIYAVTTDLLTVQTVEGATPRWIVLVRKPSDQVGVLECSLVSVEAETVSESI